MKEFRIDELAREAGTTVRNVRAYQDRGLVPPPRREGRVGLWSEAHLARLRTIQALLERGYNLQNIEELLGAWESGRDLQALLGLEDALTAPFSSEAEAELTGEELSELFGSNDLVAVGRGLELGLFEHARAKAKRGGSGELRFRVPSPRLLRAGAALHREGIPLEALLDEIRAVRRDVDRMAERFVALGSLAFERGSERGGEAPELAGAVRRIRPLAAVVVEVELARALERHMRKAIGQRFPSLAHGSTKPRAGTKATARSKPSSKAKTRATPSKR